MLVTPLYQGNKDEILPKMWQIHLICVPNLKNVTKNVWNKFNREKERDITQQFSCICLIMYPAISLQIVIYNTGIPQLEHYNVISYIDHSDWL